MPKAFDAANPPFDRLTLHEVETLRAALDIIYFSPDELIIGQNTPAESLFVVIKGTIEVRDGGDLLALLGPKDSFDSRALVHGRSGHAFVSRDETLCYAVPKATILDLIQSNPRFASFFYRDISLKLDNFVKDQEEQRYGSTMRARISELFMRPATFIDAEDTIETAGHVMHDADSNALLVRDGERTGIVTGMNLSKAVVLRRQSIRAPVRDLAHFDLVTLKSDDLVSTALVLMTKLNKRRIAIREGDRFIGILEDIDVLGFLAGSAQLLAGRIERAASRDDLLVAARETAAQVRTLRRQGVAVELIGEIISDLNQRLFSKLFEMLAPAEFRSSGCLIVMGSEGRGEQTIRTDQDNGIILRNSVDQAQLNTFRSQFSGALAEFGFPPCPGQVMVSNPTWSKPLSEYLADFRSWLALPDATSHLNLAIFYDARCVAGDPALLAEAKTSLIELVRGEQAFLAHFARAIDLFATPIGLFKNLITSEANGDALDLKKGGIFPVVHGVRSLALEHGLMETATDRRIARLRDMGVLRDDFARELTQAFRFMLMLRLDGQLAASAGASGTLVRPSSLSSMERDLLRDAFHIVKEFRDQISRHFNLGMF
ncbi:putative nucleotidyltransferase substrate binding domain-containing protein [Bradyrhizobium viridifuturi]|uniref:putative nucleotidyltransferase substrate binding domain-containing protein n=1 Tax=Bradyrhizobium viridifuturi TaxID=1654716 RepID=UPI0007C72E66|nr:putative nucleotidyltransferase substrate binding domain-containing protein [Bradyrhizobium viridifuturi]